MSKLRVNEITDLNGNLLWSESEGVGGAPVSTASGDQTLNEALQSRVIYVDTIADLQALDTSELVDGQQVQVKEYHAGTGVGGGEFYWDAARSKDEHDGLEVFSPTVPWSSSLVDFKTGVGETEGGGAGCFVKKLTKIYLADLGIVPVDDVVTAPSQAAEIVAQLELLPEDFDGVITCESGYKFPIEDVASSLPSSSFMDLAGAQTAYISPSYRIKRRGMAASDLIHDDTLFTVASGHHPAIDLVNYGTTSTSSAASIMYRTPQSDDGPGGRITGMLQFGGVATGQWGFSMRPYKPALAVRDGYSEWAEGVSYSVGAVVRRSNIFYVATSSGISGATPPTHRYGEESDGGVTWETVLATDSSRFIIQEDGRVGIGRNVLPNDTLSIQGPRESSVSTRVNLIAPREGGLIQITGQLVSGGEFVPSPELRFGGSGAQGFRMGNTSLLSIDTDSAGWGVKSHNDSVVSGSNPDVTDKYSVVFNSGNPTTVTGFTTTVSNQEIRVTNVGTGTVTLDGDFSLEGGDSTLVLTRYSTVVLRMMSSYTSQWIELSRSIK